MIFTPVREREIQGEMFMHRWICLWKEAKGTLKNFTSEVELPDFLGNAQIG